MVDLVDVCSCETRFCAFRKQDTEIHPDSGAVSYKNQCYQDRLGPASINTTPDTYGHPMTGLDEPAAAALDIARAPQGLSTHQGQPAGRMTTSERYLSEP